MTACGRTFNADCPPWRRGQQLPLFQRLMSQTACPAKRIPWSTTACPAGGATLAQRTDQHGFALPLVGVWSWSRPAWYNSVSHLPKRADRAARGMSSPVRNWLSALRLTGRFCVAPCLSTVSLPYSSCAVSVSFSGSFGGPIRRFASSPSRDRVRSIIVLVERTSWLRWAGVASTSTMIPAVVSTR